MSVARYAFVSARIGAMRSYLFDDAGIKALVETLSWEDAVSVLKDSAYGRELGKLSKPRMRDVEEVLTQSLLADYGKIITSVGGDARKFIENMGKRFEVNAIKTVALTKILRMPRERAQEEVLIPFGKITKLRLSKMLETESIDELVESMRNTEYYDALQKGLARLKEDGTPFALIASLDQYVYSNIADSIKNLSGRDRKIAKSLVGPEIDAKNLMLVLRCRELEEEKIWELLIKHRYKLSDDLLRACLSENLEILTSEQFPYRKYTAPGMKAYRKTSSLLGFELGMKKLVLDINKSMFRGDRFHIGTLIGYLNLKENEVRNLIAILKGKEEKLSPEDIKKLIILPTPVA
jgi:V/A-type H+-transporting ATPase subunit C